MEKITESNSKYRHLEQMSVHELLVNINTEDKTVPLAVEKAIPQIEALVQSIVPKMKEGGRLFYIGAGTSGRLGGVRCLRNPAYVWRAPGMGGRHYCRWRPRNPESGRKRRGQ